MQSIVLSALAAVWIGLVVYAAENTSLKSCPPPSARSVESLLAPCLEQEQHAEWLPANR